MKINKVIHLADVHLPQLDKRHPEFRAVFANTELKLKQEQPDLIIVIGDLFHDKLKISNECYLLAKEFMLMLSSIAPVVITRGNHDFLLSHKDSKIDCIQALMELADFDRVTYYKQTGFFIYENLVFVVWHHGDHYSPWNQAELPAGDRDSTFYATDLDKLMAEHQSIEGAKEAGYIFINLFHDPIRDCVTDAGYVMDGENYLPITAFKKGDYLLAGDIHKTQYFK